MKYLVFLLSTAALAISSCGGGSESQETNNQTPQSMVETETTEGADPMANKGIGPVSSITLGPLDQAMADEGKAIYDQMCTACHKPAEKFIGPAPAGIMSRRSPEWIMNMILNPEQMVREDPIAKQLLVEYNMAPMANQGLTEDQARKILEYFRTLE
jgi:mono/diheme cytochrome c family protein